MYIFINIYRQICSLSISNIERGRQVFQTKPFHTRCSKTQRFTVFFFFFSQLSGGFCINDFIKINFRSTSRIPAALNSKRTSFSTVYGISKSYERWQNKKKKVKTLNPPKCMCCLAIVCSKKCNQEKLILWHNHCFLCCIDSKNVQV